ncbi:MAG TPA: alpha/beta hydrolase [Hyphomicrobiaceae bacterium]|nr:alpha/beta hydrolase [Hyphomicrobiaceae bacterium]
MSTRLQALSALLGSRRGRAVDLLALAGLATAGCAIIVNWRATRAEADHPPKGRFVTVSGARLHYVEQGHGRPVVFVHGNGTMLEDMLISGVVGQAAQRYRAIAFDRPGFGYSERPRTRTWTAAAQASILPEAFRLLGIDRPIVVAHSWGTLVALALALDYPRHVSALVLVSGYYYPTPRTDVALFSPPALPVLGDLLSYTVAPLIGELIAPGMTSKAFSPQGVSPRFARDFPTAMALRPSQVKAFAEDAAHMGTAAEHLSTRYRSLFPPTAVLAGDADEIVSHRQAQRLHGEIAGSRLDILRGGSHMVHHIAPERVVRAIDAVAADAAPSSRNVYG